jgi:hypothetical protein
LAKSSTSPRPQLISLPIFWQVMGLSLTVLVLAVGINTWLVIDAPQPPPTGYRMPEVVEALKSGQARLQDGRWLKAETVKTPPDYVKQSQARHARLWAFQSFVTTRLAAALGVSADTVWVNIHPLHHDLPWRHREHFEGNNAPPLLRSRAGRPPRLCFSRPQWAGGSRSGRAGSAGTGPGQSGRGPRPGRTRSIGIGATATRPAGSTPRHA